VSTLKGRVWHGVGSMALVAALASMWPVTLSGDNYCGHISASVGGLSRDGYCDGNTLVMKATVLTYPYAVSCTYSTPNPSSLSITGNGYCGNDGDGTFDEKPTFNGPYPVDSAGYSTVTVEAVDKSCIEIYFPDAVHVCVNGNSRTASSTCQRRRCCQ